MILNKRIINGKKPLHRLYFIDSPSMNAKYFISATREHWGIENRLHWNLDVVFQAYGNRISKDSGQLHLAVLRKISINLLKQEDKKVSKKRRLFKMAMGRLLHE